MATYRITYSDGGLNPGLMRARDRRELRRVLRAAAERFGDGTVTRWSCGAGCTHEHYHLGTHEGCLDADVETGG